MRCAALTPTPLTKIDPSCISHFCHVFSLGKLGATNGVRVVMGEFELKSAFGWEKNLGLFPLWEYLCKPDQSEGMDGFSSVFLPSVCEGKAPRLWLAPFHTTWASKCSTRITENLPCGPAASAGQASWGCLGPPWQQMPRELGLGFGVCPANDVDDMLIFIQDEALSRFADHGKYKV